MLKIVGNSLKDLCRSPEAIISLRTAYLMEITRQKNPTETKAEAWFKEFVSHNHSKLSEQQIRKLCQITKCWELHEDNLKVLQKDASNWPLNPSTFWGVLSETRPSNNFDLIRHCYEQLQQIEDSTRLNPIRRRLILVITFEAVQKEEQRVRKARKARKATLRRKSTPANSLSYLSQGLDAIVRRVWGSRGLSLKEVKEKKKKLARIARYGKKWSQIQPVGLILGLGGTSKL